MTLELLIVAAARILGSLPVLRWAFAGALIAIAVDFSDLFMISLIHLGGVDDYQSADKWLDLVYMVTFLAVALRWAGTVRNVAVGLFAFRMIGVASFEITHARAVLLAFPNVFEFWFVGVSWFRHWKPRYEFTARRVVIWLLVALALKMVQEWVLHGGRYLDKYEAVQVVTDWWDRIAGLF